MKSWRGVLSWVTASSSGNWRSAAMRSLYSRIHPKDKICYRYCTATSSSPEAPQWKPHQTQRATCRHEDTLSNTNNYFDAWTLVGPNFTRETKYDTYLYLEMRVSRSSVGERMPGLPHPRIIHICMEAPPPPRKEGEREKEKNRWRGKDYRNPIKYNCTSNCIQENGHRM